MQLFSLAGDFNGVGVRTTQEVPRRVSVIDVISSVTMTKNPHQSWTNLSSRNPDVLQSVEDFKFPGQGQRATPVTDAKGLVMLINYLPGPRAAQFRAAGADVLVRYLGGDESLVEEVKHNRALQQALPADAPTRIFREEVEARINGRGIQDHRVAGVYLTRYGDKLISTPPEGYEVLGYGTTEDICRRKGEHGRRFGDCDVLDFVPTYNGAVETQFQRYLRNQKRLIKGRVLGETTEVHELFIVKTDQEDYDKLYAALLAIEKSNPHPISREEEIRLEEMKARKAEAEAEKAKIEVEIKRVETNAQVEIARENAGAQVAIAEAESSKEQFKAMQQREKRKRQPVQATAPPANISPPTKMPAHIKPTHVSFDLLVGREEHRPVRQFTPEGELIGQFPSVSQAGKSHPTFRGGAIWTAAFDEDESDTFAGYKWVAVPEHERPTGVVTRRYSETGSIVQRRPDGSFVNTYNGITKAAKAINVVNDTLRKAIDEEIPCKRYFWSER